MPAPGVGFVLSNVVHSPEGQGPSKPSQATAVHPGGTASALGLSVIAAGPSACIVGPAPPLAVFRSGGEPTAGELPDVPAPMAAQGPEDPEVTVAVGVRVGTGRFAAISTAAPQSSRPLP